ncbi:SPOR domain-containing protein [Neptunicella marina]|uniref:SPOR domain-containing protein n=1 Tax=Neptunicella marina TaxID=2125989 RepID=A0A8J6IZ92_9ALTE|nr:hypothetical protein [Neptunicella marina]MBC3767612.1 hypothetical protein [Neptunicella marina]
MQEHIDLAGYTDLHNRLDHLVTYSSQLIFVSGEGLNVESEFVERYLAKKSDVANIAYLGAANRLSQSQYRQRIVEQLVGKVRLDYSRPLTEILPRILGNEEQFILIAVTSADNLSQSMLSELWDVVLQNRFARQRHHLNILLFGQHQWAEQAKSWLPTNHSDQPVLLSHHSLPATQSTDLTHSETELEALIREKRQQFDLRLQQRNKTIYREPVLSKWWAKLLITLVFVISFIGIMQWQYYEQSKALFNDVYAMFLGPAPQPVAIKAVDEENAESNVTTNSTEYTTEVGPVQQNTSLDLTNDVAPQQDASLISDWENASTKADERAQHIRGTESALKKVTLDAADPNKLDDNTDNINNEESNQDILSDDGFSDENILEPVTNGHENDVVDYQVEDITRVEQIEDPQLPDDIRPQQYAYDGAILLSHDISGFYLQLSGMSSEYVLSEFLKDNKLEDKVWIYRTQRYGGNWYVVLLRQYFGTLEDARKAVSTLSASLVAEEPFAKPASQVDQEITQGKIN